MKALTILLLTLFIAGSVFGANLTFTFANDTVTTDVITLDTYFEFDVMVHSDVADTRLGDNIVYVNYNTAGFGESVVANGNITVEKRGLLTGEVLGSDLYGIVNIADNSTSKFAVTVGYNFESSPDWANVVPTTPDTLLHVKIKIADSNESSGLSFDEAIMAGKQYQSDNSTKYSPIVASDVMDVSLQTVSSLEEINSADLPTVFRLHQNYPNPFNPSTTISFDVPKYSGELSLVVYDILGRKVNTLFSGPINAGRFQFTWNGKSAAGINVPSGIYFAVMQTSSFNQTIQMVLVK